MASHATYFDAVSAVPPSSLHAYLESQNWRKVAPYGNAGYVYGLNKDVRELLVPSSVLADYGIRVSQVLDTLASVEQRDERDILRDISWADYDLVRVRLPEAGEDGSVSLDAGVTLLRESRDLLLAAACAAHRVQPAFHVRRNKKAVDYIRTVRMGQTEPGSFIANLLSPMLADEGHFARKVTGKLASGLRSAEESMSAINLAGDVREIEHKIPLGVSANLCDALANLLICRDAQSLDISVRWALTHPLPEERAQVKFSSSDEPALRDAAHWLKEIWQRR